jgi:hypothetical protein
MCLLIHKPADQIFHEDWLRDFHKRNDDGFGFMHVEDGYLMVYKAIGSANDFVQAFEERKDKECLIHLRMRTHGEINLDNCHPYEVLSREEGGPIWVMHNGVLSHGNEADKTMSDTWHYIQKTLKPILLVHPDMLRLEAFQKLVSRDIGSTNRLGFMDKDGAVTIINRSAGVEWEKAWLSNTYAWSAAKAKIPGVPQYNYSGGGGYGGYGNYGYSSFSNEWRDKKVGRGYLSNMFNILRESGMKEAYRELTYRDLEAGFDADPEAMAELCEAIIDEDFLPDVDDEFIIKWVRALGTMRASEAGKELSRAEENYHLLGWS